MIARFIESPLTVVLGVLIGFSAALFAPAIIDYGREQYEEWRPVIRDWRVTSSNVNGADLIISGTMIKTRDCLLVPPAIARDDDGNAYQLESLPAWRAKDSSPTPQPWGPWRIVNGAGKPLTMTMVYICAGNRPTIVRVGRYAGAR